jgi:hypothetical protein
MPLLHLILFNWVSGTITIVSAGLALYATWTKVKNVNVKTRKSQIELLESMLQILDRDMPYDRLLIEYQFESLFGMRLSVEEIKLLAKLPSPLRSIRLRIESSGKIKCEDSVFTSLIRESTLNIAITLWSIFYWFFAILLAVFYIAFLATRNPMWFYGIGVAIFAIASWNLYSKEFYSAKLFLSIDH